MITILILFLLILLGAPLFAVIAAGAFWSFYQADIDLQAMVIEFNGIAEMPILLAIPLFTFAGYMLSESKAPQRMVRLTSALMGWMPAGLAIVSLVACAFFTAFTGASGVTIIALGAILFPAMQKAGYPNKFNLGLVTSAGSLGLLFAPSLPLILYGVIAEVPIADLFLAGLLPGFLMLLILSTYSIWKNRAIRVPLGDFSWKEVRSALRESVWEIPLPIVVLGGVYSGYFAISEAAAVTALYVLIIDVLILKEISFKKLPAIIRESMILVGGIMLILGVSRASTNFMIDAGVPQQMLEWISGFVSNEIAFMMMLLVFLLVLGAILDIFSAIVLVVPLILPVGIQFGIDPIHLGIVFLATMQLGYITPPVGLNLFIAGYRFDRSIVEVYLSTLPFFFLLLVSVLLIAFWPALSLVLLG
ncbi:MAG: TRAP transporter large permease subunit [Xanthomonadales bacterium]|nr:TRAP transporter large permease subunit [Xanthomonadales bacterium]